MRVAAVTAALLAGCGDASGQEQTAAEIYAAAIRWLVDDGRDSEPVEGERVFVESVDEAGIPLAVQADVVNLLEDELSVRFIDAWEEAIDTAEPGDPVRDAGVLIGLGAVDVEERSPVRIYVDRYRHLLDVAAYDMLIERRAGRWRVTGDPRPVPVVERDRDQRG